jgi:hypothetical protein
MTTAEIYEMEKIEQTCDEVRRMNAELVEEVSQLRHALGECYKANCLGKTKKIADIIDATLYPNRMR